MKKTPQANTSGSGNSGWGGSENLDATSVLRPDDVHAAAADNAPTTVFSSDETQVLSDYQDATQVLNAQEATALADHQEPTEVIGATRPLPRAYRAPIKIPETIPSAQERASQNGYSADKPLQATRRLDPPKPPVSGYPLNANMGTGHMGAGHMGATQMGAGQMRAEQISAQKPLPQRVPPQAPQQAPQQPVTYPPEAYPAAAYPNGAYVQTGQVPVDASGRPVNRPGEGEIMHLPSTGILMRHIMALLFLGLSLYGAFAFFIYTATGQQVDEQAYTEYAHQFKSYRGPTLTALDSLPTIVGVIAVLGLVAVLIWKHRFLPSLLGVLVGTAAVTSTYLLKHYLIVKPDLGVQEALSNSAPSGHTTFAAAAGAALFLAVPRFLRPTVALCAALATCLTGASTIINGWHRPADVVTAILVTAIWTVVGMGVLRYVRPADFAVPARGGLVLVPLMTIATLFLSFCAVILYLIAIFAPIPGGAFTAATCMIIAVSFGTTALMVNLLRPRNSNRSAYSKVWSYQ